MKRDPFAIIEEYLQDANPDVRSNAVTALAALDANKQALERIVDMALTDEDAKVRRRADQELIAVQGETLPLLADVLSNLLTARDQLKRLKVYALLGRLRSGGSRVTLSPLAFLARCMLSMRLYTSYRAAHPIQNPLFFLRTWAPAMVGGGVGAILLGISLAVFAYRIDALSQQTEIMQSLMGAFLLAAFAAVTSSFRCVPLNLQYFQWPASVVSAIEAGCGGLLTGVVSFLVLRFSDFTDKWREQALFLLVVLPLSICAVRVGTILSLGVTQNQRKTRWAQSLVGAAAGVLALTTTASIVGYSRFHRLVLSEVEIGQLWFVYVPTMVASATTFSWIDSQAAGSRRRRPIWSMLVVAPLVFGLAFVFSRKSADPADGNRSAIQLGEVSGWVTNEVRKFPFRAGFQLSSAARVQLLAARPPAARTTFSPILFNISLNDRLGKRLDSDRGLPLQLSRILPPGSYGFIIAEVIGRHSETDLGPESFLRFLLGTRGVVKEAPPTSGEPLVVVIGVTRNSLK